MWRSLSIAGLGLTLLSLNAVAQPAPPPMAQSASPEDQQSADQYAQADMSCRRSAASRTGYRADATSAVQQRYAAAYYACMNGENGSLPPPDGYAYSQPPPGYYDYGPYPYSYAYPYYYPPYYYGPAVTFGFGFGGYHGGFHGGGRG